MPPASTSSRKAARSSPRAPAKRATPKRIQRRMTDAHKQALTDGRAMRATVDRYLTALNAPKKRGRKVTKATVERRLAEARASLATATGAERVVTAQRVRDLRSKLAQMQPRTTTDIKRVEADFVKIAKRFSDQRGIADGTWRDARVPAEVLKRAGIARTRG